MWNRGELKREARAVLSKCYLTALAVTVITALLSNSDKVTSRIMLSIPAVSLRLPAFDALPRITLDLALFIMGLALLSMFINTIFMLFVSGPVRVGEARYFLEGTQYRFDLGNILHGFTCGRYGNIVLTLLVREIFLTLWSLLFIIPGIVKSYAYCLTPFIMAENPNIRPTRAIDISCRMTKGYKWDIFVLGLSFLGWYMLGALAFGFGVALVVPYERATNAQVYVMLRERAIDKGIVTLEELEYGF